MIKLRLSFGNGAAGKEISIVDGESLQTAIENATEGVPLGQHTLGEVFNVVLNGHVIDSSLWPTVRLVERDEVHITPKIREGESGQLFKQALLITIAIAANIWFPVAGPYALGHALLVAGITVGSTLILNSLIPPLEPDLKKKEELEESQMYSITGQSNRMKPLGIVPKAYGVHRMFPTLAATPYTELSTDPVTGEMIQYLYAIYDFGLGTPQITDLKIGETPLTQDSFTDFQYFFVDPAKPDTGLDGFDASLAKTFSLYKGDRSTQQLSLGMEDGSEIVQVSATNPEGLQQEIVLDFVCPRGLYGYSSGGVQGARNIRLQIEFAPVGSSNWRPYNDVSVVDSYSSIGGKNATEFTTPLGAVPPDHPLFGTYYSINPFLQGWGQSSGNEPYVCYFRTGANKVLVPASTGPGNAWTVGQNVFYRERLIGVIQSVSTPSGYSQFRELTLDRVISNTAYEVHAFNWRARFLSGSTTPIFDANPMNIWTIRSSATESGIAVFTGDKTAPIYATFRFTPKAIAQFQVRVRRVSTYGPFSHAVSDDLVWTGITTAYNRLPITTTKRHVFMELKIRATDQLNGNISNLSAVVSQPVQVFDEETETWSRRISNNPAWVFVDLLTNEVNKKPVPFERLHMQSILEWKDYCDEIPTPPPGQEYFEPRFQCNFILDYDTTLQEVLYQIGGAAQASLNIIDGKYGVFVDRLKTVPIQIFTPRNSRDFSSNRFYGPRPHGLKVKYIDPNLGWEISEVVAYDNGYDETNATEFEEITSFACTNHEQAWRLGRYMIAQNKLRQETMSIFVDFESIICTRGDYVQITQDVMRVGGRPARVRSVSGNVVEIDDSIDVGPEISYGYTYRSIDGEMKTSTLTPLSPKTFELDGDIPDVGDLFVVGEVDKLVLDCIVKSIVPNDDLSAQITLIERANNIFDYESESTIPDYDPQISQTSRPDFSPPLPVVGLTLGDVNWECAETQSGYRYFAEIVWDIPPGSVYEFFEIWATDGRGYRAIATTNAKYFKYYVDQERMGFEHGLKVVAVAASGRKILVADMPAVTFTPNGKTSLPSNVTGFGMSITNQTLQLSWEQVPDCDANKYEIRYSPDTNDVWEATVPLQIVDRNVNSITVQARTGVYLIKAVDFAGNKSAVASRSITTIPNLFDLNIIQTFNDAPSFNGQKEQVEKMGDAIILSTRVQGGPEEMEFFNTGYYVLADLLDLGDIYSVRLASYVRADGYRAGELISEWNQLEDVEHLNTAESDDWNIVAEYRATNEILSMADWDHLYDVEHINEGLGSGFTDWRPIPTIGDATGRVFQFRVRLDSLTPNVTPRLFDATIKADMPDRVDSFENLISSATEPTSVVYEKKFRGPDPSPNVQISIDNGQAGDYWEFENKSLEGFDIRFYDGEGIQVSRQFDVVAKGFGSRHTVTI